jgi:hypothetical protein
MRRAWKKIRYRLEWLTLKSARKIVQLLSRKACYRLALWLGSLDAMLDGRGRRVAPSNLRVAFGMAIFLIFAFDRPFRGELGLRPDSYQLIYDQLMKP